MKKNNGLKWLVVLGVVVVLAGVFFGLPYVMEKIIQDTTQNAVRPLTQANDQLKTQVAQFMNPTPTIIPDPVTIIHEIRSLARLESIQYSVEKVITAEIAQGQLDFLFGDRLLFVAHGTVIAGVDLGNLSTQNLWLEDGALYINLPPAEVFIATLNNEKSYVYDRETGLLRKSEPNLETQARQVAEREILEGALEDGILDQATLNAEAYLERLFRSLGYREVIFVQDGE